jgi:hypothetical protein
VLEGIGSGQRVRSFQTSYMILSGVLPGCSLKHLRKMQRRLEEKYGDAFLASLLRSKDAPVVAQNSILLSAFDQGPLAFNGMVQRDHGGL